MKKEYKKPVIKVITISTENILTGSKDDINNGNRFNSGSNSYVGIGDPVDGETD